MIPLPNQVSAFVNKMGNIVSPWVQYLQQFTQAPPNITKIVLGPAPFQYVAKEPGFVYVNAAAGINSINLIRGKVQLSFIATFAVVPVAVNDIVQIDYTVLPNLVYFIPSYGQNTTS